MEINSRETAEHAPAENLERVEIPPDFFNVNKNRSDTASPEKFSHIPKIEYIDNLANIDKADLNESRERIMRAYDFILNHAETPVESKTAEALSEYINSGRVFLSNTDERRHPCAGYFSRYENPEYSCIVIDINTVMEKGVSELVDTLFHEAYHAAQYKAGHKNSIIKEETRAWNLGLEMLNKYLSEHGERIRRTTPITEQEILKHYSEREGYVGFIEICKEEV